MDFNTLLLGSVLTILVIVLVVFGLKKATEIDNKNAQKITSPKETIKSNPLDKYEKEFQERFEKEQAYKKYKRANTYKNQYPIVVVIVFIVWVIGLFIFDK